MNTMERARGRWLEILPRLGIEQQFLRNRHGPCPLCGGQDRYRFDDKEGSGSYYCNGCGPGSGAILLRKFHGWDFRTMADAIDRIIGTDGPVRPQCQTKHPDTGRANDRLRRLKQILAEAADRDLVADYLTGRGLAIAPSILCGHGLLPYRHDGKMLGRFPAMVAPILGPDGGLQSIHRTYLKADLPKRKMVMPPVETIRGGAVRLFHPNDRLGIAEGIETAIAAQHKFGIPTWSVLSTGGMKTFDPPAGVRYLTIFADNDENFAGQTAAYDLARRLAGTLDQIDVKVPPTAGADWLDILNAEQRL